MSKPNNTQQPVCKTSPTGSKAWYLNGVLHRTDGPAAEYADGSKWWYLNGKLHRTDGPAVEYANGSKSWYLNGKRHRTDGPAIEYADGSKSWYLNNVKVRKPTGKTLEIGDLYKLENVLYLVCSKDGYAYTLKRVDKPEYIQVFI